MQNPNDAPKWRRARDLRRVALSGTVDARQLAQTDARQPFELAKAPFGAFFLGDPVVGRDTAVVAARF